MMRDTDFAKVDTDLCRAPARLLLSQAQDIAHRDAHRRDKGENAPPTRNFWLDALHPEDGDHYSFCPDCGNRIRDDTGLLITCTCERRRIYGVPEAGPDAGDDQSSHRTAPWTTAPFWIAVLVLAGFVIGLMIGQIDRRAAIDFIAPTAAQAREAGWVALSEGRLR